MTVESVVRSVVQNGLRPLAKVLSYRTVQTFTAKVPGGAAAGATSVTLGTLSSGLTGVREGDTFAVGAYRFTADTAAAAGVITAAPIAPALTATMAVDASLTIVQATEQSCVGWVEILDTSSALSPQIKQGDARVVIMANTLSGEPLVGARIVENGKAWTITNKGRDPAGAAWVLQVKG